MKREWHVGKARTNIHERCYGWLDTGYWYAGGPERKPYEYRFCGLVWAGKYTFGVGYTTPTKPVDLPDVTFIEEDKP